MEIMLFMTTPLSRVYLWKHTLKPGNDQSEIDFSWQMFLLFLDSLKEEMYFYYTAGHKTSLWKTSHWFSLLIVLRSAMWGLWKSYIKYQLCLSYCRNMESLFLWLLKHPGAWMPTWCISGGLLVSSEQCQLEINAFLYSKLFYSTALSLESWKIPR